MKLSGQDLSDSILAVSAQVRYVAIYRDGQLQMQERPGLLNSSSTESDKYEEVIVNPTLLKLVTQRGEIDCGGVSFVLIRYGNFYQCVIPSTGGHISVGMQLECDPLAVLETIRKVLNKQT